MARQLRNSAGTWCRFAGSNLLIDPGPGTLCSCFRVDPVLNPEALDAVILSHRHLDHSTDVNVIIEAMTAGTFKKRGSLFAPMEALAGPEPVVLKHVRSAVEHLQPLHEGGQYHVGEVSFTTPLQHDHPAETYGLRFSLGEKTVSFVTDTAFSSDLINAYQGSDLLVLNVVLYKQPSHFQIKHLDLNAAAELIEAVRPRLAVMTHFGLTMLQEDPHRTAAELSRKLGIKVLSAADGLQLELNAIYHVGGSAALS